MSTVAQGGSEAPNMDEMQIPGSSTDRLVVTYAYLACSGALRPVYGPGEDRNRGCPQDRIRRDHQPAPGLRIGRG